MERATSRIIGPHSRWQVIIAVKIHLDLSSTLLETIAAEASGQLASTLSPCMEPAPCRHHPSSTRNPSRISIFSPCCRPPWRCIPLWRNTYLYPSTMGRWILEILPRLAVCLVVQKKNAQPCNAVITQMRRPMMGFLSIFAALTCSAGGTGVLLNIEKVASQLEQLGADLQVRGLVDSGWFLESKQQKSPECPDSLSCTPVDAIKKGLR